MGHEQQATHRESNDSSAARIRAERTRAREIHHLLSKLSLSAQQAEVIERFSRSLVDEIIRGPIAETVAPTRAPNEPVANVQTLHARGEEGRDRSQRKPGEHHRGEHFIGRAGEQ